MEQVLPRFESKAFLNALSSIRKKYTQGLDSAWDYYQPQKAKENLIEIVPSDIQEKYKPEALNWIISAYILALNQGRPFGYPTKLLETFYQIKEAGMDRLLSIKDINLIKSTMELDDVITRAKPDWEIYKQSKVDKDPEAGSNKIYEDEDWEVYIPENKGAACKLGKGTDWCTAAPGLEYYAHYHKKDDPLIIFISKKDPSEKYQFHYGKYQFMDKYDNPMRENRLFYDLHYIVANSDKVPEKINMKAKWQLGDYEPHEDGGYTKNFETHTPLPNGGEKITNNLGQGSYTEKYYNANLAVHREDGPAYIVYEKGKPVTQKWYKDGLVHRDDGPAYIALDARGKEKKYWYWHGNEISQKAWKDKVELQKKLMGNYRNMDTSKMEEIIRQELIKVLQEERKLGKPSSETNLGDWFKRKGAPGKTGGWVDCNTCRDGKCKPCGRQEGEKRSKYPRCRPTPAQCKGYKRRHSNLQREE